MSLHQNMNIYICVMRDEVLKNAFKIVRRANLQGLQQIILGHRVSRSPLSCELKIKCN